MSTKTKKEIAVLLVLLGLMAISVISQRTGGVAPEATRGSLLTRHPNVVTTQPNEVVQLQLLETTISELTGVKRNIFQFGSITGATQDHRLTLPIPQSVPIVQEPSALPDVHYLGFYFEKETGLRLASIANGGRIYVGKVGQTLGGKYELLEIAMDHVVLRLTDDGKLLSVPLGKGTPNVVNRAEFKARKGAE